MHWYLVFTKPRQEQVALENLERQGYRCYLPKWQVEKKKRGRRTVEWASANEPLFPRYLFIELDTGPSGLSWGPIRSTTGVTSLVRFGLQPARAPTGLIDTLRALEAQHAQSAARPLEPGDLVSLREGPFAGLQAVYQCQDSNARAGGGGCSVPTSHRTPASPGTNGPVSCRGRLAAGQVDKADCVTPINRQSRHLLGMVALFTREEAVLYANPGRCPSGL
jgi:transcriptional antiterminator RfaH